MPWRREALETRASPARQRRAKALRRAMTEPEKRLWWHLRHRLPLEGTHFRRQVAVGPYVADFCCLARKLVIEVDGEQHGFEAERRRDERRDEYLRAQGFHVLRFANRDVVASIDVVLDTIHAALSPAPPIPAPSPQGGREIVGILR